MSAAAMISSPSTCPHSSKPLFEVSTVDARSCRAYRADVVPHTAVATGVARRADLVEQTLRRQTGELLETCLDDPGVGSQLVGHGWTWRVSPTP